MKEKKVTEVVGAAIRSKGRFLCLQRGSGRNPDTAFKFEFPGGKVNPDESAEQALHRELIEELNLDVEIKPENFYAQSLYQYESGTILLKVFLIDVDDISFKLAEHVAYKWLRPNELKNVVWSPADFPIVCKLFSDN